KDEPRLVRIFAEYPGLDRWRNWRMSETSTNYILLATGMLKRLVVVVDKGSLELRRLATSGRVWRNWSEVPDNLRDDHL
ncbi:MAG: hypothetical protein QGF59_08945, partial [Pirellulaceae bacterium]|nr:hypothetical protein [Pirellulaceae bacterium]